jgi:hypothetical protein
MNKQDLSYIPTRGGLLILIHHKYAFMENSTKMPTPSRISPYLQIIQITNHSIQPWLLINLYMPSHEEDLPLSLKIQDSISQHIHASLNHHIILCGDFNKDNALLGQHTTNNFILSSRIDNKWRTYTNTLDLTYIPTNTTYTHQGWNCYTNTNFIDNFFLHSSNSHFYHSHTHITINFKSDHFQIYLYIPSNTLLSKPPIPPLTNTSYILNPIPLASLTQFNT